MKKIVVIVVLAVLAVWYVGLLASADAEAQVPQNARKNARKILPSKITDPSGKVVFDKESSGVQSQQAHKAELARTQQEIPAIPERGFWTNYELGGARLGIFGFDNKGFRSHKEEIYVDGQLIDVDPREPKPETPFRDPRIIRDPKGSYVSWSRQTEYQLQVDVYHLKLLVYLDENWFWTFDFETVEIQWFQFYANVCLVPDMSSTGTKSSQSSAQLQVTYYVNSIGPLPEMATVAIPDLSFSAPLTLVQIYDETHGELGTIPVSQAVYEQYAAEQEFSTVLTETLFSTTAEGRKAKLPVFYPGTGYLYECGSHNDNG